MNKNNLVDNLLATDNYVEFHLSHTNIRVFQPNKLHPPRDFDKSDWEWIESSLDPVVLEIGAGKGKHAMLFAKENVDTKVIAIERTTNKFQAFCKSIVVNNRDFTNLFAIHADAIAWSVFALPPQSLSQIFLLYPNPESSNPNQQWLNMPYFEFLLSRLKDGGMITLASNIVEYIDNAEQKSINVWKLLTKREDVNINSKRTHFEIKYLQRGERCEQLIMTKPEGYITRFDTYKI